MALIKCLAADFSITFCIVNIATPSSEIDNSSPEDCAELQSDIEEIRPMLGKYWLHMPNTRCFIKKCMDNLSRTIKIVKSTHLQTGLLCSVKIGEFGVT